MKTLILVRHAKSSWDQPGLSDIERPLSKRGKRAARAIGRRLALRGQRPDLMLASPALRTRATARRLARALSYRRHAIALEPRLYEAALPALLDLIAGLDKAATRVMLVGHNPGLSLLAQHFWPPVGDLPTAAVLQLDFPVKTWPEVPGSMPLALALDLARARPAAAAAAG